MPPKSTKFQTEEEIKTVKQQLVSLQCDIQKVLMNQTEIQELLFHIESLKKENLQLKDDLKKKGARIKDLENKTDDLEQYTRSENIIISGLQVNHRSYANAVRQDSTRSHVSPPEIEDTHAQTQKLEVQVIDFLNSKGSKLEEEEISACHQLRSKKKTKDIIIRMVNRKSKFRIMKEVKTKKSLKDTNIYISEDLTTKNQELAAIGRRLRKNGHIASTWVRNGRVFIKLKETDRPVFIKDKQQFIDLGMNKNGLFH